VQVIEAFETLVKALSEIYTPREAGNMTTIIFEDVFPEIRMHQTDPLTANQITKLQDIKQRLIQHEPLQYVIGMTDFYGLRLKTDARALIPRPETEELVHLIIKDIRLKTHTGQGLSLLDIGTGTGCIPLTVKHHLKQLAVTGVDISEEALSLATENSELLGLEAQFKQVDILDHNQWDRLPKFDIIVSNPPYIPNKERSLMARNVLDYEPDLALFVEDNAPLLFYQTIAKFAQQQLNIGGVLYFEVNEYNGKELLKTLDDGQWTVCEGLEDMQGKLRMLRLEL